jgi:hypothetical protein
MAEKKKEKEEVKHYLAMAADCIGRARHGLQSGNWQYVMEQASRCVHYMQEAGFHADLKALLREDSKAPHPPPKEGMEAAKPS